MAKQHSSLKENPHRESSRMTEMGKRDTERTSEQNLSTRPPTVRDKKPERTFEQFFSISLPPSKQEKQAGRTFGLNLLISLPDYAKTQLRNNKWRT